jgi:hypothetical protein
MASIGIEYIEHFADARANAGISSGSPARVRAHRSTSADDQGTQPSYS